MRWRGTWFLGVCATLGCGAPAERVGHGSEQMADTLARIAAAELSDPLANQFLNSARADLYRGMAAQQSGPAALQTRYLLAQEQLLAGRTREAIAGLEHLRDSAKIVLSASHPENKPFHDLLAIAYLRLGEQENCNLNPAPNVCILPLDGSARHVKEEGARRAIAAYDQILRAFPNDRGSEWLLNVSHMAVGEYPGGVPAAHLIPNLDLTRRGAFPLFHNVAGEVGADIQGLSGGLAVEDFNRDGLLDIFTTSWGPGDAPHLLMADGTGGYVDRTEAAGLSKITGGLNVIHADYDNDGYDDLLILRGAWLGEAGRQPNSLLHNNGDGTFTDVTYAAGLGSRHPTHSAAWADYNLDGWLDLFVGHESSTAIGGAPHRSELYLNNHDGTFREVSHAVGVDVDAFVKGVTWGDVNNDGLPDLYVSTMYGPNRLFINRGAQAGGQWRFEEARGAAGAALPIMSFGTWFWDFNQDGWEDIIGLSYDIRATGSLHDAVAHEYRGEPPVVTGPGGTSITVESSRLYVNNRDGTFSDATAAAGLADKVIYAMGTNFGDLDNDGWLDFYVGTGNPDLRSIVPNRMFRNVDGKRFEEVTLTGGFAHLQKGHGTAFADLDRDGDEDVFMVMGGAYEGDRSTSVLFENPGWPGRSWVTLSLEGRAANRSAIGARVEVVASDSTGATRTFYRTVGTGGSFGAGSLELHIGLDHSTRIRELRVRWPDAARSTTRYTDLGVNRSYHVVQGEAPVVLQRRSVRFARDRPPLAMRASDTHPRP